MSEATPEDMALVNAATQLAVHSPMSFEDAMYMLTEAMGVRQLRERIAAVRAQAEKWATDGRATSPDGLVYLHAGRAILALLGAPPEQATDGPR